MWVAYSDSNILYAYSLSSTARTSSDDITLPTGTVPTAIRYHNNLIYAAKNGATTLKAYSTSGTEDTSKSITLNSRNRRPTALWSNDTTIWAADSSRRKLYAYSLSTRRADTTKDFNNINSHPAGLHSNGYTMWISDRQNRRIYAYDFDTKRRLSTNDFTTLTTAGNRTPTGIWGTNTGLWVADRTNHKLYAYNLPKLSNDTAINSLTLDGVEYVTTGPETSNVIDNGVTSLIIKVSLAHPDATHRIAIISSSTANFSSGAEVTCKTSIKGYQVSLATGSTHLRVKVTAQDGTTNVEHYYVLKRPTTADLDLYGFTIIYQAPIPNADPPANRTVTTQVKDLTYALPNSIETITISPIPTAGSNPAVITVPADTGTQTPGHQATLQNGINSFTARVTDNTNSSNTKNHTITITRADGSSAWDPTLDINVSIDSDTPWGIWSNRITMWVAEIQRELPLRIQPGNGRLHQGPPGKTLRSRRSSTTHRKTPPPNLSHRYLVRLRQLLGNKPLQVRPR